MSGYKRVILLIVIMSVVAVAVGAVTLWALYDAAFRQQQDRLVETAQSRARMVEAILRHEAEYSHLLAGTDHGPALESTLDQIRESHARFQGFGETGEFTMAGLEDDRIVFLLRHRHGDLDNPAAIPVDSELAEPMRRALRGESGTAVGLDYRGERVLAAHEPLAGQGLGIVAKIDMAEIRAPFVRAGLMAGSIGLAFISLGTILFLRIGSAMVRRLQELNETLEARVQERTAALESRAAQLRYLAAQLTRAEQSERKRLAQVLHDHHQQLLFGAKMQVGLLKTSGPTDDATLQSFQRLEEALDQAIDASKSLTVELYPPVLNDENLDQVLDWLADCMKRQHRLSVDVTAEPGPVPMAQEARVVLFHAVRELLFNVVKHAGVERAELSMSRIDGDRVCIEVSDDGAGFDPDRLGDATSTGGFGLFSIRERLESLGGRLKVKSRPGRGTRVRLAIPVLEGAIGRISNGAAALALALIAASAALAGPPAAEVGPAGSDPAPLVAGQDFHVADPFFARLATQLLEENPRLRAARAGWRSATQHVKRTGTLPDPWLSYRYYARTPETRVGPQQHGLELSQTVPWAGKLGLETERAEQLAESTYWNLRDLERALVAELKRSWFETLYLQEALAVNAEERELLRGFEEIALTRYATGEGIQQDVVKVQTEISRLSDRGLLLRRQLDVASRRMAELVGRPGSPVTFAATAPELPDLSIDGSLLENQAELEHPLVRAAESRIAAEETRARRRELDGRPDFRFGMGYTMVGERDDAAGILNPPPDNGKDLLALTVGVNLPIWRKKIRAGIAEAEQSARSAGHALESTRDGLSFAVQDALLRLESSAERAGLYREVIVPQAGESLASAESAYRTGRQGFLELLDAERVLFEARLAHRRLVADWWIAAADLERALGRAFPEAAAEKLIEPPPVTPVEEARP